MLIMLTSFRRTPQLILREPSIKYFICTTLISVIHQLALDIVPVTRTWVGDIVSLDGDAGVESVEGDFATAFPFRHVNLLWPALHGCEPERRP